MIRSGDHAAGGFGSFDEQGVGEFGDGAAVVVGEETRAAGGAWGEAPDPQVGIQKDRRDVRAGDEIVQILVRLAEFVDLGLVLVVERLEFLVHALQFLVRALEFLVRGLQFLVRGLEFLVGRLQFLDGGFQAGAAVAQLLLEVGDALHAFAEPDGVCFVGVALFGVLEKDEEKNPVVFRGADRLDGEGDISGSIRGFAWNRPEMTGLFLGENAGRHGAKRGGDAFGKKFREVHARASLLEADVAAGVAEAVEDFQAAVQHEAGLVDPAQDAVGKSLEKPSGGVVRKCRSR